VIDLVVLGGGPAGLGAAIDAAQEGWSVVVLEPRRGDIDKACGEGVLPAGVAALRDLGVRDLAGRAFTGVRYSDAHAPQRAAAADFADGPGLGVRRVTLHARLTARAAEVGVEMRQTRAEDVDVRADVVRVGGLRARWAIAADGLHSPTRAALGLALRPSRAPRFGIRRHFAVRPWSDRVEILLAPGAEAYVTPVGAELVGVAILFEGRGVYEELLARFPTLRARLGGASAATAARGAGPFEQRVRARVFRDRLLLVGDAAGYCDALTGEGIALGLQTARAAVRCLREGRPEAYEAAWRALAARPLALTAGLLALVRRRALHRPLLAGAAAFPSVMAAAVAALTSSGASEGSRTSTPPRAPSNGGRRTEPC